jgi:AraC-like DNA-binding protein
MTPAPDQPTRLTLRVAAGSDEDFELWRWALSPVWDVAVADAPAAFSCQSHSYIFGSVSIGAARAVGGTRFRRAGREIGRSGGDHIMVVTYDRGGCDVTAGGAETRVRPGDVAFLDLGRPADLIAAPNASITCLLPRRMLENLLPRPDDLHGLVIGAARPASGLLRAHLRFLLTQAPRLPAGQRRNMVESTAHLVAACADPAGDAPGPAGEAVFAGKMNQIRAAIEAGLGDGGLGPEMLVKTCHVSRASLYRMFEPLGGVSGYIQERRLVRAHRDLTDPALFRLRINQIADRSGFAGHAAFSAAFKSHYGMAPSEARAQARRGFRERHGPRDVKDTSFGALNRWLLGFPAASA